MNTNKIIQSLVYLASKEKNSVLDNMKAYKLLWLADRLHLRLHGRTITGDCYYALPYGPVPSDAKHILENTPTHLYNDANYQAKYITIMDGHSFSPASEPDLKELSESDMEVLDRVWQSYGKMKPWQLSRMSHTYPEWLAYKDKLEGTDIPKACPIDLELFFEDAGSDNKGLFVDTPELIALTKELYLQHHRI